VIGRSRRQASTPEVVDVLPALNETRYLEAETRLWRSFGATPTERRLRLRRNNVTVRVQEVGAGPNVLFVHGANTSGASWVALASRLAGFHSILLDRPGTGLSEALARRLDATTLPAFGDTLIVDVLDALGLSSAHLVATSFGGYIALRTAAAHPERVERMVQFSWPVGAPNPHLPVFMRMAGLPLVGRLMAALPASERSVRMIFRQMGHGPSLDAGRITHADIDAYLALLRDTNTMRNELAPSRAFISPIRGLNRLLLPDSVLAKVTTPTHFLWGEHDPFGSPATGRALVDRLPNATIEILPGAGHAPWLDDLDHSVAFVERFLRFR
jgi:pimeloyl-ACP methyl ester carboxylesterase